MNARGIGVGMSICIHVLISVTSFIRAGVEATP